MCLFYGKLILSGIADRFFFVSAELQDKDERWKVGEEYALQFVVCRLVLLTNHSMSSSVFSQNDQEWNKKAFLSHQLTPKP